MSPDHSLASLSPCNPLVPRTGLDRPRHQSGGFAEARATAERVEATQKTQAARTVASNSLDLTECREFLAMLGIYDSTPNKRSTR